MRCGDREGLGGHPRDLISLAESAGEEAYVSARDRVELDDVRRAIDAFGRSLAVGLDDAQVRILKHLQVEGGFVVRGELELSLVETRRVIQFSGMRWSVHPALAPLLADIPDAA